MTAPIPGALWRHPVQGYMLVESATATHARVLVADNDGPLVVEMTVDHWHAGMRAEGNPWREVKIPTDGDLFAVLSTAHTSGASVAEAVIMALGCVDDLHAIPLVLRAMTIRHAAGGAS